MVSVSENFPDFLVVGGGVAGLSTAYYLGRAGVSVTVLEAGEPGQASGAAAGMLAPLAEAKEPGPTLDLALESLRRWPDFAEALREAGGQVEVQGPGMLRVARTDAEEAAHCECFEWQSTLGMPLHRLSGREARRLEPELGPDVQAAILSPQERQVEPRLLLDSLRTACRRFGVEFVSGRMDALDAVGRRVVGVQASGERLMFGQMILAGGAWSRALGETLGLSVPVTPLRGQILALGPRLPVPAAHTIYAHGSYLVPRADGRIVAGATEEWAGFQADTDAGTVAALRAEAACLLPALADWPLHSAWAGLRPVSADGLPLLGRVPGWDNVSLATGYGRNGILLSPVAGFLLAEHLLHNRPLPPAFDPARASSGEML